MADSPFTAASPSLKTAIISEETLHMSILAKQESHTVDIKILGSDLMGLMINCGYFFFLNTMGLHWG